MMVREVQGARRAHEAERGELEPVPGKRRAGGAQGVVIGRKD